MTETRTVAQDLRVTLAIALGTLLLVGYVGVLISLFGRGEGAQQVLQEHALLLSQAPLSGALMGLFFLSGSWTAWRAAQGVPGFQGLWMLTLLQLLGALSGEVVNLEPQEPFVSALMSLMLLAMGLAALSMANLPPLPLRLPVGERAVLNLRLLGRSAAVLAGLVLAGLSLYHQDWAGAAFWTFGSLLFASPGREKQAEAKG